MAYFPHEFPLFTKLSNDLLKQKAHRIANCLGDIPSTLEISGLMVSEDCIAEIIERVEKRRIYFHIFHNGMKLGELNEFALYCFWILKLTPFNCQSMQNNELNAKIALKLFLNAIHIVANGRKSKVNLKAEIVQELYYSFRYRDLSKEAIMNLAESLIY